jgi:hypothetical protein
MWKSSRPNGLFCWPRHLDGRNSHLLLDREGEVVYESKTASIARAIADELAKAPSCRRIVFETGRLAPILFHGLHRQAIKYAQGAHCSGAPSRHHHARYDAGRNRVRRGVDPAIDKTGDRIQLPRGATPEGGSRRRRRFCRKRPNDRLTAFSTSPPCAQLTHQAPASAQRTQASPRRRIPRRAPP